MKFYIKQKAAKGLQLFKTLILLYQDIPLMP